MSYPESGTIREGAVVQHGLRFAPGACEIVGSNPTGPTSERISPSFALLPFPEKPGLFKPAGTAETDFNQLFGLYSSSGSLAASWPASYDLSEAQSEFASYPVGYFYAVRLLLALD